MGVSLKLSSGDRLMGSGTGFVIRADRDPALLATNRHVADAEMDDGGQVSHVKRGRTRKLGTDAVPKRDVPFAGPFWRFIEKRRRFLDAVVSPWRKPSQRHSNDRWILRALAQVHDDDSAAHPPPAGGWVQANHETTKVRKHEIANLRRSGSPPLRSLPAEIVLSSFHAFVISLIRWPSHDRSDPCSPLKRSPW